MKKQIISLLVLISLSFQTTYPMLEKAKERFSGPIAQSTYPLLEKVKGASTQAVVEKIRARFSGPIARAKSLLNARENIRCVRYGDNCSQEKRLLLGTISALVAALVAAGVTAAGARLLGGKKDELATKQSVVPKQAAPLTDAQKTNIGEIFQYALGSFDTPGVVHTIRSKASSANLRLNQIVAEDGMTLLGAFLLRLQMAPAYNQGQASVLSDLLREGIKPSDADIQALHGFERYGNLENKPGKEIAKEIIRKVKEAAGIVAL